MSQFYGIFLFIGVHVLFVYNKVYFIHLIFLSLNLKHQLHYNKCLTIDAEEKNCMPTNKIRDYRLTPIKSTL